MSDVELISKKSFSDIDSEIIDRFMEFQQALIDKDEAKLNEILTEKYELIHMSGKKQTKQEFIGEIMDGTLNYYKSEIIEPTILWDDDERPTLLLIDSSGNPIADKDDDIVDVDAESDKDNITII